MSRILLTYHLPFLSSSLETKVVDVRGKPLNRGTGKGMAYANFKTHKFSYLNITTIGSDYVGKGSECGFACVNIPSCFSFNLVPSDLYNNSDKLVLSQSHHHHSIAVSWKRKNVHSVFIKGNEEELLSIAKTGFLKLFKNTPKS